MGQAGHGLPHQRNHSMMEGPWDWVLYEGVLETLRYYVVLELHEMLQQIYVATILRWYCSPGGVEWETIEKYQRY